MHFQLVSQCFFEIIFHSFGYLCHKELKYSLELVREGCLLNDLNAPKGIDLNLFGHELRACKPIIPI